MPRGASRRYPVEPITAAECSVRGKSLSFVREAPRECESGPGSRQAGIPEPSPPRVRSCEKL
eukprot:365194-Chlamydomonas_euryale.AAC.6